MIKRSIRATTFSNVTSFCKFFNRLVLSGAKLLHTVKYFRFLSLLDNNYIHICLTIGHTICRSLLVVEKIVYVRDGFSNLQCKMLSLNWLDPQPCSWRGQLGVLDRFSYLAGCISSYGHISDKVYLCIQKHRFTFTYLRNPRHRSNIRSPIEVWVYIIWVRSVLLYIFETLPLRPGYMCKRWVFEHFCPLSIGRILLADFARNSEFGQTLLDTWVQCLNRALNQNGWGRLEYVLRKPMSCVVVQGKWQWEDGLAWPVEDLAKSAKTLPSGLADVGPERLPCWNSRDCSSKRWLETVDNTAPFCSRWCSCIRNLPCVQLFNLLLCIASSTFSWHHLQFWLNGAVRWQSKLEHVWDVINGCKN